MDIQNTESGAAGTSPGLTGQALDLLFPFHCLLCGTEKNAHPHYLCAECAAKIRRQPGPACTLCAKPLAPGDGQEFCIRCRKQPKPHYAAAYAPAVYDGLARKAVTMMKRAKKKVLLPAMAAMMAQYAGKFMADLGNTGLIVPVPAHWTKMLTRGFNPASELALLVGKELGIPVTESALARRFFTRPQKNLPQKARAQNARTSYTRTGNDGEITGKRILLIDDILTTGATADECSRLLIEGGAEKVSLLVFAGTEKKDRPKDGPR